MRNGLFLLLLAGIVAAETIPYALKDPAISEVAEYLDQQIRKRVEKNGDASQTTGAVVAVSSTSLVTTITLSASYVGIATTTAELRGGRPVLYEWVLSFDNQAAQIRTYTCQMSENSVPLIVSNRKTQITSSRNYETMAGHTLLPSSTAGTMNLSLLCKTDNATGTQLAQTPHLTIIEF